MRRAAPRDAQDWGGLLAACAAAGLLSAILLGPLLIVGWQALSGEGAGKLLSAPGIGRSAVLSLWTGLTATALAYVGALVLAALLGGSKGAAEGVMKLLLAVPHTAAALGLAFLLAPSGLLARAASPFFGWEAPPSFSLPGDPYGGSLILGLASKELPFLFIMVLTALRRLPERQLGGQLASLGYGRLRGWLFVLMPLVHRQTRTAALIALVYAVGSTEQSLILGRAPDAALPVRLLEWFRDPDLSARSTLAAGAVLLMLTAGASVLLWEGALRAAGALLRRRLERGRRAGSFELAAFPAFLFAVLLLLALCLGLAGLSLSSFAGPWRFPSLLPAGLSMGVWRQQAPLLLRPLATSAGLAVLCAVLSVSLALGLVEIVRGRAILSRAAPFLLLSVLLIPEPVLMFGLGAALFLAGGGGGFVGVLLLHLVYTLPYAFLLLHAADSAVPSNLAKAARSLGANRWRVFLEVRLPLLWPTAMVGGLLAAIISAGLSLPTLVGGGGRVVTLTTEGVALAFGDRRIAGAFTMLLILLPALLLLLSEAGRRLAGKRGAGDA
jgi:putative thiamine transport system permease protein